MAGIKEQLKQDLKNVAAYSTVTTEQTSGLKKASTKVGFGLKQDLSVRNSVNLTDMKGALKDTIAT